MRVLCRHGHFSFFPDRLSDVTRLSRLFSLTLLPEQDFFTFPLLVNAPRWSLPAQAWLGLPAIVAYEGRHPWDVMRENGFVFSIPLQTIVPKASILNTAQVFSTQDWFVSTGNLIQPGARDSSGQQILSYHGRFDLDLGTFRMTGFSYE